MNRITILVQGEVGVGKSTISKLIADTLHEKGIEVAVYDNETHTHEWEGYQNKRIDAIKNDLVVEIHPRQIVKGFNHA